MVVVSDYELSSPNCATTCIILPRMSVLQYDVILARIEPYLFLTIVSTLITIKKGAPQSRQRKPSYIGHVCVCTFFFMFDSKFKIAYDIFLLKCVSVILTLES